MAENRLYKSPAVIFGDIFNNENKWEKDMNRWISTIIGLLLSINSNAAVVSYDEAIHGDLVNTGNFATNPYLGYFGVGTNTVTGELTMTFTAGQDANDPFRFSISEGHRLSSVTLFLSHSNNISELVFNLGAMSPFGSLAQVDAAAPSPISAFSSVLPLGSGEYYLSMFKTTGTGGAVNIDYTWQFEVAAVPIPAAVWLFATGLIGISVVANRGARS